jgi:large subunit ribosomal protein L32e
MTDVIKEFMSIKGIGEAKAKALYSSGFDSLEKLRDATVEDLTKVKGISRKNAEDILNQLKEVEKEEISVEEEVKVAEEIPEVAKEEEYVEIVEEERYRVKRKPELDVERRGKLLLRRRIKRRTPVFLREEWFRYKRIPRNWRRPDGITSKMRINLKYRPSKVRVGFRGPKEVRGLHPSGFEEVLVHNVRDLEKVDPKKQAVRIGGTVGMKKRLEIAKMAEELEIRVLNFRV